MKTRKMYAVITAMLMLLACIGCGSKTENATDYIAGDSAPGIVPENADEEAMPDAKLSAHKSKFAGEAVEGEAGEAAPELYRDEAAPAAAIDGGMKEFTMADGGDIAIDPPVIDEPVEPAEIGQLTAGEWKDHENWGFFANLVNNGTISFPSFGIDPTQRITVNVTAADGSVLPNAAVTLLDGDHNAIWKAVTNKDGIAYLFETNGRKGAFVSASNPDGADAETELETARSDSQGANLVTDRQVSVTIEGSAVYYPETQVMFIVDTTGSMGDEMFYLQSDFSAIAEEVGTDQTSYGVRFYRDEGDAYVTKTGSGFTTDTSQIRSALNAENADGGGDEPEAVAEALSEAFSSDDWNTEAAKIAFLIYDAPPHTGKENMLQEAIETAAAKGIRLVPVVSSNGSRETELFGRAAAICTGGSYVFLTDDSGIGGSHLEPIIGDYEVEKLHDIIVRIIRDTQQK